MMKEKRPLLDNIQYKYKLVDEVEKDGKFYKKYKRVPRLGGALIVAQQALKIVLVGVVAVLLSHVLINTIFSEKKPAARSAQR